MKSNISKTYGSLAVCLLGSLLFLAPACKKNSSSTPHPQNILPDSAGANATLYLTGSGLSDVTNIVFSNGNVPAPFNPNFNTDGAVIFRVPDTALGGPQNIVFTNKAGAKFSVPFNVRAFPAVTTVSNYDYNPGDTITLTGSNFELVTNVGLRGSSATPTILSKSHHTLQLKMPANSLSRSNLVITNPTGSDTTSQEFINIANSFVIFANGNYGANIVNGSWGPATISSAVQLTHYPTFAATYQKGNWSADGFAYWSAPYFPTDPTYTYFTFWVYGAAVSETYYITSTDATKGYGNGDVSNPIVIPPNTWTYFKLPIQKLGITANTSGSFQQLGWYIQGPNAADETLYFDDVLFVK